MSILRPILLGSVGKIIGALFCALCAALGFGPDEWAAWLLGGNLTLLLAARIAFVTMATLTFALLTAPRFYAWRDRQRREAIANARSIHINPVLGWDIVSNARAARPQVVASIHGHNDKISGRTLHVHIRVVNEGPDIKRCYAQIEGALGIGIDPVLLRTERQCRENGCWEGEERPTFVLKRFSPVTLPLLWRVQRGARHLGLIDADRSEVPLIAEDLKFNLVIYGGETPFRFSGRICYSSRGHQTLELESTWKALVDGTKPRRWPK